MSSFTSDKEINTVKRQGKVDQYGIKTTCEGPFGVQARVVGPKLLKMFLHIIYIPTIEISEHFPLNLLNEEVIVGFDSGGVTHF